MGKLMRQKIEERQDFSWEERQVDIAKKSDERCCHCGKKVYFGFGATVEHFVPLSKGGTNRYINLYMLCEDCNKEKGNNIYRPSDYMEYLKPEYLKELNDYFNSYIHSFEFVNKNNLLSCDRYKVGIIHATEKKSKKIKKKAIKNITTFFWIKKATQKDVQKITDFMYEVVKKRISNTNREMIENIVVFFFLHGCIYYQETSQGIRTASFISTRYNRFSEVKKYLRIDSFALYNNPQTLSMLWNFANDVPFYLLHEQGLEQIPVEARFPLNQIPAQHHIHYTKDFKNDFTPDEDEKLGDFFKRFGVTDRKKYIEWNKKDIDNELLNLFFDTWEIISKGE